MTSSEMVRSSIMMLTMVTATMTPVLVVGHFPEVSPMWIVRRKAYSDQCYLFLLYMPAK